MINRLKNTENWTNYTEIRGNVFICCVCVIFGFYLDQEVEGEKIGSEIIIHFQGLGKKS